MIAIDIQIDITNKALASFISIFAFSSNINDNIERPILIGGVSVLAYGVYKDTETFDAKKLLS